MVISPANPKESAPDMLNQVGHYDDRKLLKTMKRIHITGCPRSGTTLMMEMMRTCFHNDAFCMHEMSIFEKPESGHPEIFFSKQPSDIRWIKSLLRADDNLYVINMIRDPRAVITSIHRNFPGMYFCNFRIWNECHQKSQQLMKHPHFLQIRYEDLVADPGQVQDAIQKVIPFLAKKHDFSEYHNFAKPSANANAAMGGIRKISTARIAGWKNHLPRIKHEYQHHPAMADILIMLGYESDKKWGDQLNDVAAKKGMCRYPDHAKKLKSAESKIRNSLKILKYIITK